MSARIRPIVLEDLEEVVEMFLEDLASLNIQHDYDTLESVVKDVILSPSQSILLGAESEGIHRLDGVLFANVYRSVKHGGKAVWLEQLYVRREKRRSGLGRELVDSLMDWAEDAGIQGIDLESYRLNAPASVLYRSLGFRRLGRERFTFEFWDEEETSQDENGD